MSSTSLVFTLVDDDGVERSITLNQVKKDLATTANIQSIGQNLLTVSGTDSIKSVELVEQTISPLDINFSG